MVEDFQKMKNKALPLPGRVVESTVPPVVFVEDIQDLVQLYQKTQLSLNKYLDHLNYLNYVYV